MALRTIEAPGVEIKEIDKSGYTPVMTGTRCYVMGYSDKGTPYEPMQFTSKAAWQNYYGDPDNEAERYFYNACSEVMNQNGVLYCARLPYENKAKDKMVGFKFKVSTYSSLNPTAGEYLLQPGVSRWTDHDSDFEQDALNYVFDNKCLREIDGNLSNGLEHDKEIRAFYKTAIKQYNDTYDKLESFARYSIDYYKVNAEESKKLSARFVSKQDAIDYLEQFKGIERKGNYKYVVDEGPDGKYLSSYCILSDDGDWLAMPLYCEYNKEATVLCSYTYPSQLTLDKIPDLVARVNAMSASIIAAGKTFYPIETMSDLIQNINTGLGSLTKRDELMNLGDVKYVLSTFNQQNPVGEEIKRDGYLYNRINELKLSSQLSIDALDLYKHHDDNFKFVVPEYHDVIHWRDGADNEFLMRNTTTKLYSDEILNLSAARTSDSTFISTLWETELWEFYKGKNLSTIIRYNQQQDAGGLQIENWENKIDSWGKMLSVYKMEGNIKFETLILKNTDLRDKVGGTTTRDGSYGVWRDRIHDDVPYYRLVDLDPNLHDYLTITQSQQPITCDLTAVDEYRTGENNVPANTFWVFDKTCATLNSIPEDYRKGKDRQCIGIFPVVTTVANALYAQSLITPTDDEVIDYETLSGLITKSKKVDNEGYDTAVLSDCNEPKISDMSRKLSQCDRTSDDQSAIDTLSREANGYFLPIQMNPQGTGIDMEHAKKIGVVVYKAYLDASEGNKISFNPVESFVGSLDKDAKNPNTGVSTFIDKIVNSQSDYIYFFSNCFCNAATKKEYNEVADFFVCNTGKSGMLGWFSDETEEKISLTGIYQGIDKCFQKVEDINERDIDIICDAGLANIAQYLKSIYNGSANYYDLAATDEGGNPLIKNWKASDVNAWKTVQFKYDNFCKNVRKDCMFIADGVRPLVLQGEKKIIRSSKPANTIDANILPNVKYITGLNTNYGAGYMDWFQVTDEFTGDEFWCPPSIKAMGVYINTDLNFNYWDAPAGLNRGVIQALDCAFSPTIKQAGPIYQKNWNYAINYPYDGIVLEGQKTFQVKPSAFDRVNVRRLFLRLERQTYKVARYFVYEGNTAYTRQRLVDMLDPLFYTAKVGGGIYDYKIICDESNNTPNVIDNNELRVKIGIKPVKTAEFILIDFIALATGGSFSEM